MKRRVFIKNGLFTLGSLSAMSLHNFALEAGKLEEAATPMPVLFVGHGAPLYALSENKYSLAWRSLGQKLPKPKAIVSISAHWLTPGKTLVTAAPNPRTIHDFGRMDDRLFQMQYPAPGSPELAEAITHTIATPPVAADTQWGFDHGTWCVLYHMYPNADIPVIQLSIDYAKGPGFHYQFGQQLHFLRNKGILVVCSGNIVHNLRILQHDEAAAYDWALEFDQMAAALMSKGDFKTLIEYRNLGRPADLSIPTPDHYYPLMYALGMKTENEALIYPVEGLAYGSTSMRSVLIGNV